MERYPWQTPNKRIYLSFDAEHDWHHRHMLDVLRRTTGRRTPLLIPPYEPGGPIDVDATRTLRERLLAHTTHTLVIVGPWDNHLHRDRNRIGARNWQWWEIEQSQRFGVQLLAVKLNADCKPPEPLLGCGTEWIHPYSLTAIRRAIAMC